jgi:hypothetical protein
MLSYNLPKIAERFKADGFDFKKWTRNAKAQGRALGFNGESSRRYSKGC